MSARIVELTHAERAILFDRMDVPDAIAEAILAPQDAVDWRCARFKADIRAHKGLCHGPYDFVERQILEDCVLGSTWVARSGNPGASRRCLQNLATKVEEVIGRPLNGELPND